MNLTSRSKLFKIFLIAIILSIMIATIILVFCWNEIILGISLKPFKKIIEQENLDDLSLSIYYADPFLMTNPYSVNDLIDGRHGANRVVINSDNLKEHIDLFKKVSSSDLVIVKHKSFLDARLYYVFESKKHGKVLEVVMWGLSRQTNGEYIYRIFVNGIQVEDTDALYIITPFLQEDVANYYKSP